MQRPRKKKIGARVQRRKRSVLPFGRWWRGNARPYMIVSAVVVVVLAIIGLAYYQQYVKPFQSVIITVDNQQVRMGYFLERARMSGSGGISTLQTITNEILIRDAAPRYSITVTPQDVEAYLRQQATGSGNTTVTNAEFNEWYHQLLYTNKVSDKTYRQIIADQLLATKLENYLAYSITPTVPTADVYGIFVSSYKDALQAQQRVHAGEDFSVVAQQMSLDSSASKGGELGWIPRGVNLMNMDPFMLKVGEVSDPLAVQSSPNSTPSEYYVLMVKQVEDRPVDPQYLPQLKSKAMQDWLNAETKKHTVKWAYNSKIDAWVNYQLSKNSPPTTTASGGSSGTGR